VVVMKSIIFWDITPCSSLKVNWRFRETYRLHLQGRRIIRARNQHERCTCRLPSRWFLARLILRPWRWRRYVPLKRQLTFNGLRGVISRKTVLFSDACVFKNKFHDACHVFIHFAHG
jgi:hypothetical protein